MTKPKRIIIVGHMGAGKSLLAKALAEKLKWQYVDSNLGLERYMGRRMHEIMGKQGEEAFHQFEAEILDYYHNKENLVLVLDDAVVDTEKNRKLLSREFVVYLKVDTATQLERMADGITSVFPIANQNVFLDELHAERDPLFEEVSTLVVDSQSVDEDVKSIVDKIN
jgi:shikimate kinase